jgi:hypothetical protein
MKKTKIRQVTKKLKSTIKSEKVNKVLKPVIEDKISATVDTLKKPRKKRGTNKMYFTTDTEDAIIEYNITTDDDIRNKVYEKKIKYAFEKLVENIFNTFKFTYFDSGPLEIQKEVLTHLVTNMHKYEKDKGKAFSYFSIVAKNYLIFHNNNNYKRFNQHVNISDTPSESSVCLQANDTYHKDVELDEFMNMMISYWEKNLNKIFTKKKDFGIAAAVVELFRNYKRIDCFNKKALYFYIREMSDCRTQQITKVINKFKSHQDNITRLYRENGTFSTK